MIEQQHHEMVLATVHESGAEEWFCPTCGRRFLMQWPPEYKKVILEPGDEYAIHSGGKNSANIQPNTMVRGEEELVAVDDSSLQPFIEWMESVGFESLWQG